MGETLQSFLDNYGAIAAYGLLFLYSFGGGFIAIIVVAVLASSGRLDITICIALAVVGNFIGGQILFALARFNKGEIYKIFAKQRRQLALATKLFSRYGAVAAVVHKFIYGLKTLVPIAIGATKYSFAAFTLFNAIGALLWGLVFGVGGFLAGDLFLKVADDYGFVMPFVFAALVVGILIYLKVATRKRV